MGVELVPTPKAPKNRSLAIRLIAKFHQLRMPLFGLSARALKTLAVESSLKEHRDEVCGVVEKTLILTFQAKATLLEDRAGTYVLQRFKT